MTMQLRWRQLCGPLVYIIAIIVLCQLHLITSAPTSTVRAPADDVTNHVTPSWQRGTDVTERRPTFFSNGETTQSVPSNASDSETNNRRRREVQTSQGCGPVCNRCRQVRLLSWGLSVSMSVCLPVC